MIKCSKCGRAKEPRSTHNRCPKCNAEFPLDEKCYHINPQGHPDVNTQRNMYSLAHAERRFATMWGVVHPGNAFCVGVFQTKKEAESHRKAHAGAYAVVRVCITPLYEKGDFRGKAKY